MVYNGNPIRIHDLGVPLFLETPMYVHVKLRPCSFVCRATPNQSLSFGTLNVECNMPLRVHQKKETPNQSLNFKYPRDDAYNKPFLFTPTSSGSFYSIRPKSIQKLSSRHATSQMALIRGISKSTTPPVDLKTVTLVKLWPSLHSNPAAVWVYRLKYPSHGAGERISVESWTLTYLDLDSWRFLANYYTKRFYKCHSNCKAYLVQGSLQVLIGFQSIWDQNSLAKNTVVSQHVGVSKNRGTPKSWILIGFSTISHPFLGYPYFWKHPCVSHIFPV